MRVRLAFGLPSPIPLFTFTEKAFRLFVAISQ